MRIDKIDDVKYILVTPDGKKFINAAGNLTRDINQAEEMNSHGCVGQAKHRMKKQHDMDGVIMRVGISKIYTEV